MASAHDSPAHAGSIYRAVVIGGSAGGLDALQKILACLPASYPLPLLVVLHLHRSDSGRLAKHLSATVAQEVQEASDKATIASPRVYTAPADYHLLVERDETLALSIDPKVNWSRPSIDVLFESAARAWGHRLIAVLLSGANQDGARGMKLVHDLGGTCIAQDPADADTPIMPRAAMAQVPTLEVLAPPAIGERLLQLAGVTRSSAKACEEEVSR